MTRRYVLVNAVSGQIVARGALTNLIRQKPLYRELYELWGLPFAADIRLDQTVTPERARAEGAL